MTGRPGSQIPDEKAGRPHRARCDVCGGVIESHHDWDVVTCPCGRLCLSGGPRQRRVSWQADPGSSWTDLSDEEAEEEAASDGTSTMDLSGLLVELFGRIPPLAREAVDGLDRDQLVRRPGPGANPIGWLVWHIARVEDCQVAPITGADQVWVGGDWAPRFGLPADPSNSGYGHTEGQVAAVRPEGPGVLVEYMDAVHARTTEFLGGVGPGDLDRIVDRSWDPPVTVGVRLVSIAVDCLEHAGQAAYARSLLGF